MTLVLQIENYRVLDDGGPAQFTVPEQGAKVGRSASMDWTLPDATRHISSHHFDVLVQQGTFYLRDVSTNGTFIYGTRDRVTGFHALRDGDRFQVGTYLIRAVMAERTQIVSASDQTVFMAQPAHAAPAAQPPAAAAPVPPPQSTPQSPIPRPVPQPAPQAPAAAPVPPPPQPPLQPAPPPVAPAPPAAPAMPDPVVSQAPEPLPDFDAVPDLTAPPPNPPFIPEDALIPDDDLLLPEDPPAAPDAAESADGPKKRDYSRIFEDVPDREVQRPPQADKTGFDDPSPVQAPPSVQLPDLDFIDDFAAPSIPPSTYAEDLDKTGRLSLPPHEFLALERAAKEKERVKAQRGAPGPVDGPDLILKAFCEGAGLSGDVADGIDAETLARALGASARIAAREIKLMLEARAATKQFTRGGARTMRKGTDSNPLKFMPDAEQALDVMYLNPRDGYQSGPDALEEALTDLRRHQTALFAAIQPALMAMMQGLTPKEIEAETEGGLMSGSGRSWDRFKTRYAERIEGHDNGLLDVFLTHFAKAYGEAMADDD